VLFDIDGTLIRSGGAGALAFEHAFASEFGICHATHGVRFSGRTDVSLVREIFRRAGIEPAQAQFDQFFESYVFWLDHLMPQTRGETCVHVRELLDAFSRLCEPPAMGLLTGNIRLGAEIKLRWFDLWQSFALGAFADDHEDRNRLAHIAQQRGSDLLGRPLAGDDILIIGDTPADIACARAIGARCVAVATGGSKLAELEAHHPTWAVPDLRGVDAAELCRPRGR